MSESLRESRHRLPVGIDAFNLFQMDEKRLASYEQLVKRLSVKLRSRVLSEVRLKTKSAK